MTSRKYSFEKEDACAGESFLAIPDSNPSNAPTTENETQQSRSHLLTSLRNQHNLFPNRYQCILNLFENIKLALDTLERLD
jgi:hypothetical protein